MNNIEESQTLCVKEFKQVSYTWEAFINDAKLEKVTEQLRTTKTEVNQMKKFPLANKMTKATEMKKVQQQVVAL